MLHTDMQYDLQQESIPGLPQNPELVRHDQHLIHEDTVADSLHRPIVGPRRGSDVVFLCQTEARVHDSVRQLAVVGKQEQPLGIPVETTDGIDPLAHLDQVHDGPAISLITRRRDVTRRFV
jgi:hypothetical protein